MRQKIVKIGISLLLAFSVFFSHSITAQAAEPILPEDYVGSASLSSSSSSVFTSSTGYILDDSGKIEENLLLGYAGNNTFTMQIELQAGYVYNGSIYWAVTTRIPTGYPDVGSFSPVSVNLASASCLAGSSAFLRSYSRLPSYNSYYVGFDFNNFVCYASGTYHFTCVADYSISCMMVKGVTNWPPTYLALPTTLATDYVGNLTQQPVSASENLTQIQIIQDSEHFEQQMQQQQEIAAAQASQSAQQHEDLKTGYDTSEIDSIQQNQQSQLDAYQKEQDQAVDSAYSQVGAFTDGAFSTAPIAGYATSFAFVGLLFNKLWASFGNFTTILVLMLSLGVAGFILQIRKEM